jgi:hypothetical protein
MKDSVHSPWDRVTRFLGRFFDAGTSTRSIFQVIDEIDSEATAAAPPNALAGGAEARLPKDGRMES